MLRKVLTVVTTMLIATSAASLFSTPVAANEHESLVQEVQVAEAKASSLSLVEETQINEPATATLTEDGISGETGLGEISIGISESDWATVSKETQVDTENATVAKVSGNVGTLLKKWMLAVVQKL